MSENCNVEDILCQIEALKALRTLQSSLGNETFSEEWPELVGLDDKLSDRIATTKGDLKSALAQCGNVDLAEIDLGNEPSPEYRSFYGEDEIEEED